MSKELEQERRKKEFELQKKYNDKTIRIKYGKTFSKSTSLIRKQKRILMKDKNFLNEIIKIILKYFPQLKGMFSKLTDKRHKSYITYNMQTIIFTKLIALICRITTITGINDTFNSEESIKNLSTICNQSLKKYQIDKQFKMLLNNLVMMK